MTSATERWSLEHGMQVRRIGAGPELVWIHGLGEWSVNFDALARRPELAAWTHVLVDLPGYGRSPRAHLPALDDLAGVLANWLAGRPPGESVGLPDGPPDRLTPGSSYGGRRSAPPAALIGHSMGGVLATLVAERCPVRAVVNVDGNLSRGDCTFSLQAKAYTLDDFVAHGFARMRDEVHAKGATDAALRGYHGALCATDAAAFHHHAIDLVRLSDGEQLAPRLAALAVPTLYIAGVPGGICEYSRALLTRLGVRWVAIEPSGHWIHIDRPDAFVDAVAGFLATV